MRTIKGNKIKILKFWFVAGLLFKSVNKSVLPKHWSYWSKVHKHNIIRTFYEVKKSDSVPGTVPTWGDFDKNGTHSIKYIVIVKTASLINLVTE